MIPFRSTIARCYRTRLKSRLVAATALAAFMLSAAASRADETECVAPRRLSLGKAFVALADDGSAVDSNPAGMSQARKLTVEGAFGYGILVKDSRYWASIVDSKTAASAMGFSYNRIEWRDDLLDRVNTGELYTLAFSFPAGEYLFIGANAKNYIVSSRTHWTGDTGLILKLLDNSLSLGLTGENLLNVRDRFDIPLKFNLGAAYLISPRWLVSGQYGKNVEIHGWQGSSWRAGTELSIRDSFFLRAGFEKYKVRSFVYSNALRLERFPERTGLSAGGGWFSEGFAINYAFRQVVEEKLDSVHAVSVMLILDEEAKPW
jgi:hypothetical protein